MQCQAIIDSGSQVTTISKSFHDTYLSSLPILPLRDILEVEGAGGQNVPYLGYVEVSIQFPENITGKAELVSTLALVVPDCRSSAECPALLGTNIPLIRNIYSTCHTKQNTDMVGKVKLQCKKAIVIPPGEKRVLSGYVRRVPTHKGGPLLVEPSTQSSLPSGLSFCSYVMSSPQQTCFKVPILLKNETAHNITVPPNHSVAELSIPHSLSPLSTSSDKVEEDQVSQPLSSAAERTTVGSTNHTDTITFDFADSSLPEEWKERITKKLNSIPEVFASGDLDYGHTTAVKHKIRLSDPTPFKQRARPIHPSDYEAVRLHLKELLDAGVIRESESPFSSPIVVVKKKNGAIRLCVDYRKLNNQTIKDAYALPNIEETFAALTGSKWFSVMDLKSGYYQVEVDEEDKYKTAFVTPMGFWEFNRLPQGVTNAPSTFQRVMEKCMGSLNLKEVLVFLDDLIVFADTLEEHERRLMQVLHRLKEFGLKLSPEKCHFFKKSVKYLGHVVSENGVETDPGKIAPLTTWPRPTNISELKSFLGFTGYYRRFVKDYSKIAKPLNALTAGYLPPRKKSKSSKFFSNSDLKRPFNERWTSDCEDAFKALIGKLTTAPILGFANPRKPYVLHTDASLHGLGAALYQEQDGEMRVIAYASRGLSNCERRYPTHKLEFLALKWAVTDKFFDYLYGAEFTVMTDNNPLTYVLTSAKLDAAGHRWLAALSNFNFNIQYRAGKRNADADGLSRRPHDQAGADQSTQVEDDRVKQFISRFVDEGSESSFPKEAFKAICQRHELYCFSNDEESSHSHVSVECFAVDVSAIPAEFSQADLLPGSSTLPRMSQQDWAAEQRNDPQISRTIDLVNMGKRLTYRVRRQEDREVQLMLRVFDQLVLDNGVLYRKRMNQGERFYQLVLPAKFREMALEGLHDSVGHMGMDRTLDLVRTRFYWPRMFMDVEKKVRTCERCVRRKAKAEKTARLVNIQTSRPLELVCMDYLSLEPDGRGTKNILVITDHFTKYAVAVPTADQRAKTVAKTLWNSFFVHYGLPERLHSDQGRDFESVLIKDLCQLLGIKKTRTTPYHPRGNPVERFNRTLLEMLGTLQEEDKVNWRDHVQPLVHAYNTTKNDTTGFSPYQLMFGRQPNLPIDVAFGLNPEGRKKVTHADYVKKMRENLQENYKLAIEHSEKTAQRNKQRYDLKVRESTLEEGDRVLVKNVSFRGKHKIADRWSSTVYKVIKHIDGSPVYVVAPVNSEGPERTLHRDLLLPCGFLASSIQDELRQDTEKRGKTPTPQASEIPQEATEPEQSWENEEEIDYYYQQTAKEDVTFPTITIVREIPHSRVDLTEVNNEDELNSEVSSLNPEADAVHPMENQEVSTPEEEEENLPVEKDLPVEDAPGVESESVQDQSVEGNAHEINDGNVEEEKGEDKTYLATREESRVEEKDGNELSVSEDNPVQKEIGSSEVRRTTRQRAEPDRLTYKSLGNPLAFVMHSILNSLDQVVMQALDFTSAPKVGQTLHV